MITLDQLESGAARKMLAKQRVQEMCQKLGISYSTICSRYKSCDFTDYRRIIAFAMRDEGFSSSLIGYGMNKCHTSILYYFKDAKCQKI